MERRLRIGRLDLDAVVPAVGTVTDALRPKIPVIGTSSHQKPVLAVWHGPDAP